MLQTPSTIPLPPPFQFESTPEAVEHNSKILAEFDFDLSKLTAHHKGSAIDYGSEFRDLSVLKLLFCNHPNYDYLESVLTEGMQYFFTRELTEDERVTELRANIIQGNHRSATGNQKVFDTMIQKDVKIGFALPVATDILLKVPNCMVQPGGIVRQMICLVHAQKIFVL